MRRITPTGPTALARRYAEAKAAGYPDWLSYQQATPEEIKARLEARQKQEKANAEFAVLDLASRL